MSDHAWGLVFVVVVAIAIVAFITIWQAIRTHHEASLAQAAANQDETYRALAEEVRAATRKPAETQERITAELVEIRGRIAAIEKLLSGVG